MSMTITPFGPASGDGAGPSATAAAALQALASEDETRPYKDLAATMRAALGETRDTTVTQTDTYDATKPSPNVPSARGSTAS
jgi:hypothetical protein